MYRAMYLAIANLAIALLVCAPGHAADDATSDPGAAKAEFALAYKTFQRLNDEGKHEEALPYAERAYELGLQIYGEAHSNTAALALNLGETYDKTGHRKEAVKTLDKAIELYQRVYGKDSRELIDPLMARADATGAWDVKARSDLYKQALDVARDYVKSDDLLLAHLNLEAGIHLLRDGNVEESKPFLDAAYSQYRKQIPANDPRALIAALWVGKYQMAISKPKAAEPYFNQVLTALGDNGANPLALASHVLLVTVYEQLDQSEKATPHCVAVGRLEPWQESAPREPLYKTEPEYPAEAKGHDGYATIEFTIDAAGFVRDPKLLETQGSDTFGEPGLAAIREWRYAPRFVDDRPVDTAGMQAKVEFKLTP
jgi:TonB family protein